MTDAAADELGLLAQALRRPVELAPQLGQVGAARVGQLDVLEEVPDALVERVEVGGVAGQLLQAEASGGAPQRC